MIIPKKKLRVPREIIFHGSYVYGQRREKKKKKQKNKGRGKKCKGGKWERRMVLK